MEAFTYLPLVDRVEQLERNVEQLQLVVKSMQQAMHKNDISMHVPAPPLPAQTSSPPSIPRSPAAVPPSAPQTFVSPIQRPRAPQQVYGPPVSQSTAPAQAFTVPAIQPSGPKQPAFNLVQSTEYWLNKIGIGLFLLGIMFFFKYSIDQGWVTPALRVITGILTGFGFLGLGLRLQHSRRGFSQVLLGGGLATLYISIFAAFQLFHLVPYPVAFGAMVSVTLLGFVLALRQNNVILSLITTAGALGTPFILYTGSGNIPGLMGYTCLVLAGTSAIYFFKGWRSLLWLSFAGGVVILLMAASTLPYDVQLALDDRWALQGGGIMTWLLFWLVPVAALVRKGQDSVIHPDSDQLWGRELRRVTDLAHQLSLSTGLGLLAFSGLIWRLNEEQLGGVAFAGVGCYALAGAIVWSTRRARDLVYTQGIVATMLLTLGFALTLHGDVLFWTLAVEAAALHLLAWRIKDPLFTLGGHGLAALVGLWFIIRLDPMLNQIVMLNARALTDLAALALLYGVSYLFVRQLDSRVYRFAIHAAMLAWLWRELAGQPGSYTLLAWAAYSLGLHALANVPTRREWGILAHMAAATIILSFLSTLDSIAITHMPIFNIQALLDLATLALLYGASYFVARQPEMGLHTYEIYEARIYRFAVHAAMFGWLWRELADQPMSYTMLTWAAYSFGLQILARVPERREWRLLAHGATIMIGLWFQSTLFNLAYETPIFNLQGASQLVIIGLVGAAALTMRPRTEALIYGVGAYAALLLWLWHEFAVLASGNALTTIGWGVCALIMFGFGLRRDHQPGLRVAVVTVGLIVIKLFLIDLANVDAIWRILLFLGFGSVFLALSYGFRSLWRPAAQISE